MIHKMLFGYTTRLPVIVMIIMYTLWGPDPNALHVHTNFRVHMLGVAFLHMYTGIF